MKIKILVMPFLLVLIISLCIWLVYPVYSNGYDGIKENYIQLEKEKNKLKSIQNKSSNVKELSDKISSSPEDLDILRKFIPLDSKEEEIEDNISYLAYAAGLSILSIKLNEIKSESLKKSDTDLSINADINVSGSYEALKKFIDSLNKLRRYNSIEILSIIKAKEDAVTNTETDTAKVLDAKLVINFVFMHKTKLTDKDVNNSIFSAQNFNTDIVSQIKNKKSTNILQLNVGNQGKANPFMP